MKNEIISERQATILIILFLLGNSLLSGSANQANQDVWIAITIAISLPIFLYIPYILMLKYKNIYRNILKL